MSHRAGAVSRNDCDVALIPGACVALREAYCELRQAGEVFTQEIREASRRGGGCRPLARPRRDRGLRPVRAETVNREPDWIESCGGACIASTAGALPPDDPARATPEWLHASLTGHKPVCIMKMEASA